MILYIYIYIYIHAHQSSILQDIAGLRRLDRLDLFLLAAGFIRRDFADVAQWCTMLMREGHNSAVLKWRSISKRICILRYVSFQTFTCKIVS